MYKQLFGAALLESSPGAENYFTLEQIADYVSTDSYIDGVDFNYWSSKLPQYNKTYKNNLIDIKAQGLPTSKSEQYNFANLRKLYNLEILDAPDVQYDMERFSYLADKYKTIVQDLQ